MANIMDLLKSCMTYVECSICNEKYELFFLNIIIYKVDNEYFNDCCVCGYCLLENGFFRCEFCDEWDKFENFQVVCINDEYMVIHKGEIEKYRKWLNSFD